ncbi:MAG: ABC transporter substrate-binding protein, partial [Desulfovibrio sp.]|nr:ABC transporter substrate-binding protein [Desulfovibrio sp.]
MTCRAVCSGILTGIFRRLCPLLPLALLGALSGPPALAAPVEITDDTGHTLRLEQPARRIIPLYGAFGEMLVALGCGDRLVARTDADAALPELAHLPAVGTHMRPNAELVAAARPDLVLQMSGRGEALLQTEGLRKLGVPVLC